MKKKTEKKWFGVDCNLEISLMEYGFLLCKNEHCEQDEYFIVFRAINDLFGWSYINEKDLNNLIDGKGWANEEQVKGFLKTAGMEAEEWKNLSIASKISDVFSYWGEKNLVNDYDPQPLYEFLKTHNIVL